MIILYKNEPPFEFHSPLDKLLFYGISIICVFGMITGAFMFTGILAWYFLPG